MIIADWINFETFVNEVFGLKREFIQQTRIVDKVNSQMKQNEFDKYVSKSVASYSQ